jgi:putative membrane protein
MSINDIPALNACLNAIATVLMTLGFFFIRRGDKVTHRKMMLSAGVVSAIFLVGYVGHKILVKGVHTPFGGEGFIRSFYYAMLISHIILAIAIAYLVPRTFWLAIKGDFERHKKWARWTFPIWFYVSVTGVLVYLFLYQWWPSTV